MNRRWLRLCALILTAGFLGGIFLLFPTVSAQSEETAGAGLYQEIDRYLRDGIQKAQIPAMAITIVEKDGVLFSQSYGECRDCDTPFLLGSVSKSFTAVCLMQLVEQKKVDLNAAISTYLPDATDGKRITVRQLLNHTSGLGEHQTLKNYKIVREQGIHHYANVNYSLLGEILEAVSGQSYRDYITQNLWNPLGLSHTAATLAESQANGLIDGYTNYWGIPLKRRHQYPSSKDSWIQVPAGYLSASVRDLGKYLQMYLNGGAGILSPKSIDTLFYGDTVFVDGDVPYWYGYGWTTIREPLTEPVLRHSGLVETGTACVFVLPEREVAVAITCNVNDYFVTNEMMDSLGWGVVLLLLGQAPNEISGHAYFWNHLWINLIQLVVLLSAIFSCCLLPRYRKRRGQAPRFQTALLPVLFDLFAAAVVLFLVPVLFATPLWVAKAFVPDIAITVAVSSALFLISGGIKGIILFRQRKRRKEKEGRE